MGQAHILVIPGDFKDFGAEFPQIFSGRGILPQTCHEIFHAFQLQGRTEPAGEQLSCVDSPVDRILR